jgi:translation initiation factor 3 subunit B
VSVRSLVVGGLAEVDTNRPALTLSGRLENKTVTHFAWSPKGRHIALATVGSSAKSDIEFWDLDFSIDDSATRRENAEPGANMQLLGVGDHFGVTNLAWDPSGRYLASIASAWENSVRRCEDLSNFA